MPNREPNRTPRPTTCANLRELASAYQPILLFSRAERFFPLRAESWLGHATGADWRDGDVAFHADDLELDAHRRGTALLQEDTGSGSLTHIAGPPGPANRPLLLPSAAGDTTLNSFRQASDDVFLSFAGWADDTRRAGDPDYLYSAFSEQAAAINSTNPWDAFDLQPNRPLLWVPQPVSPSVYAEVQLVSAHVQLDRDISGTGADFPPGPDGAPYTELDDLLCVTYHYLFALADHVPDTTAPPRREGQWEAASIYFPIRRDGDSAQVLEPPTNVVLTRGRDGELHVRVPLAWADVAVVPVGGKSTDAQSGGGGTAPVLLVGEGTHHLLSDISGADTGSQGVPPLGFELGGGTDAGTRFWLTIAFLVWALAVLAWAITAILALAALLAAAAVLAVIFAVLVAIFILIVVLVAIFGGSDPSTTANPPTQEADTEGPAAGDTEEPAGGDPAGGGGSGGGGGGADAGGEPSGGNAGSPTGRDTVPFDLRVVDLLNDTGEETPFPPTEPCEHPSWWDYSGRWGVRVAGSTAMDWTHGDRRVDEQGRTLAYWNSAMLAAFVDDDS